MKQLIFKISAIVLLAFGLLTLFMSSSVLFDWFGIREMEGHYVLFVVIANWMCGFVYVVSAYGLYQGRRWTLPLLGVALAILFVTMIALLIHIRNNGAYEEQTVKAMIFRISVNLLFVVIALKSKRLDG